MKLMQQGKIGRRVVGDMRSSNAWQYLKVPAAQADTVAARWCPPWAALRSLTMNDLRYTNKNQSKVLAVRAGRAIRQAQEGPATINSHRFPSNHKVSQPFFTNCASRMDKPRRPRGLCSRPPGRAWPGEN